MTTTKPLTERKKAVILADLRNQMLDIRLGSITKAEWQTRVKKSAALGVSVPAEWLK